MNMDTIQASEHSPPSLHGDSGAARFFLQPAVDLQRPRSRPALVASLIGIIVLSTACMTQNLRTSPDTDTATAQMLPDREGAAAGAGAMAP